MNKYLVITAIVISSLQAKTASQIISLSEAMYRGKTSQATMEMTIETAKWKRSIKMKLWVKGTTRSFVKIDYPKRDKGVTFLKRNNEMWQYVPKVEKVIKIPPSMMMQAWMGSDFTNDDLMRESSMSQDYHSKIVSQDAKEWTLELIPREDSAVVWGKLLMKINKNTYLPVQQNFYDEDMTLINCLYFRNIRKANDRFYAATMEMIPQEEDKKGHKTTITTTSIIFDQPINSRIFTLRNLKAASR